MLLSKTAHVSATWVVLCCAHLRAWKVFTVLPGVRIWVYYCTSRVKTGLGQEALDCLCFKLLLHHTIPHFSLRSALIPLPVIVNSRLGYLTFFESPLSEH